MKTHILKKARPTVSFGRVWLGHAVFGFCLILFCSVNKVYADVYINEVAWMGTSVSSTNEWVELYNDSVNDVDLEGWVLTAEDGSPNITITSATNGVIGAKKYYLIERTDDTTVPDVVADFVAAFGSGLSNNGEKLLLKKPDGTVVDNLDYKAGWPAGDNTTKQTMQRVSSSWVTAVATPRAVNAGASSDTNNTNTNSNTITGGATIEAKKELILKPKITIISNKDIVTNVTTSFDVLYTGTTSIPITYGYFVWSMGDGTTYNFNQQKKFTHIYQYPGDYTVNVAYFNNTWSEDPVIETSSVIHVENVNISISALGTDGTVTITNTSDQDMSLSKWQLSEGSVIYTFPYGMKVLANKSIIVPARVTGFKGLQTLILYYPNGLVYGNTSSIPTLVQTPTLVKKVVQKNTTNKNPIVITENTNSTPLFNNIIKSNSDIFTNEVLTTDGIALTANVFGSEESNTQKTNTRWWVFVVLFFIVCGLGYLAMKVYRSKQESVQEEFHLLDE